MENYDAWQRFVSSGKIADYLAYKEVCANIYTTVGDLSKDADKNRRNRDKTTEN